MEIFSVIIESPKGSNPCEFFTLLNPVIDVSIGEWWVSANSISRNYDLDIIPETLYLTTDITKPVRFGDRVFNILACLNGSTRAVKYYEEQLQYIKIQNGVYQSITITTTDEDGRVLTTNDRDRGLLLELKFKGILPPKPDEKEGVEINNLFNSLDLDQ